MLNTIKDGTGDGFSAQVDSKNRLHVASVGRTEDNAAISDGRFFIASSQVVTLTDDLVTPVLLIENLDTRDLVLDIMITTTGTSTNGVGNSYLSTWAFLDNSSTIISNAVPASVGNSNTLSVELFNGNVYLGQTGDTIVGATQFVTFIQQPGDKEEQGLRAILGKNGNTALAYQAPAGNTNMEVSIIVAFYYLDSELP